MRCLPWHPVGDHRGGESSSTLRSRGGTRGSPGSCSAAQACLGAAGPRGKAARRTDPASHPPVLLAGDGRLLDHVEGTLKCTHVVDAPGITHLTYDIVR